MVQTVKRLPSMQEIWVRSLGWEDPLEKDMATHSSTLAWKISRTEEPGRLQSMGSVGHVCTTENIILTSKCPMELFTLHSGIFVFVTWIH